MGKVANINPWLAELSEQRCAKPDGLRVRNKKRNHSKQQEQKLWQASHDRTSRSKAPVQCGGRGEEQNSAWGPWFDSSKCLLYTHKMKVEQCQVHQGFPNKCWMMMRRPVKELASHHHSGTPVQHSTVAHKPDLSQRGNIPTPDGLLRKGRALLQVQRLIREFISYLHCISVYTCSRVNANGTGCALCIS